MNGIIIATPGDVLIVQPDSSAVRRAEIPSGARPTGLCADPWSPERAWCSTRGSGVLRTDDGGATWRSVGLESESLMTVAVSPAETGLVWVGADPSAVWRSSDNGETWRQTAPLEDLPSAPTWAFPPRPETHHARWVCPHPTDPGKLWVAIEAGALVRTWDGGATWMDRVPDGPYDTHELAIHQAMPDTLRSAAGDGYLESRDGGLTWSSPMDGLDVGYLRSVAIDPGDPETVIVSGASSARTTYVSGRSDGRVYRREGDGRWGRVTAGWPDPPSTIAPLLISGRGRGEFWAADDRGVHLSVDSGRSWEVVAKLDPSPDHLRGVALVG